MKRALCTMLAIAGWLLTTIAWIGAPSEQAGAGASGPLVVRFPFAQWVSHPQCQNCLELERERKRFFSEFDAALALHGVPTALPGVKQ